MLLDRRLIIRFITVGAPAEFIPHPISIELPLHLGKPHNIIAVFLIGPKDQVLPRMKSTIIPPKMVSHLLEILRAKSTSVCLTGGLRIT